MVLITDGGSTKCDWILLDETGEQRFKTRTQGLNPAVFGKDILEGRLDENKDLTRVKNDITRVDFFGAGCSAKDAMAHLSCVLHDFFQNAEIHIDSDMKAAALSVTTKPGIICILGTGSNSCYFDGKDVHTPLKSLGYVLMDEASGNYFGKQLIRDYYYKRMPGLLADQFENQFDLRPAVIKYNLYRKEHPNVYLAHFAEFIFDNDQNAFHDYFYKLLYQGFITFIKTHVMCFKETQQVPVHFVGSIAHFSKDTIADSLLPFNLKLGQVVRRPIDGLIAYYRDYIL